ncbi:MAG: GIY-YIG nuclease family protein [Candidatus Abawacabacteria bacterium]|nr:GIY-YIG nuclease family protein [Candidatus Abawacabacteria bacterium]
MFYVYIIASKSRVIYIGVTNNLNHRIEEHRTNYHPNSFTAKYKCYRLVYFELFQQPLDAIAREKQLKRWSRNKKANLIEQENPHWVNLV